MLDRASAALFLLAVASAASLATPSKPRCCWSQWGTPDQCGNYVGPSGGHCNLDPSKTCNSNADCPDTPAPPPTPPGPPAPPTPTPPPVPPSPGPLPDKVVGLYLLIADDGWPYKSDTEWVPRLPQYMYDGGVNVLWLAFVNPEDMPALPPAMGYVGKHRPNGTKVSSQLLIQ